MCCERGYIWGTIHDLDTKMEFTRLYKLTNQSSSDQDYHGGVTNSAKSQKVTTIHFELMAKQAQTYILIQTSILSHTFASIIIVKSLSG